MLLKRCNSGSCFIYFNLYAEVYTLLFFAFKTLLLLSWHYFVNVYYFVVVVLYCYYNSFLKIAVILTFKGSNICIKSFNDGNS